MNPIEPTYSDELVQEMRRLYSSGLCSYKELTEKYGISSGYLSRIMTGTARKKATGGEPVEIGRRIAPLHGHPGESHPMHVLTEEDVINIRKVWADGASEKELADSYKVSISTISAIVCNRTWKHLPSAWDLKGT